MSSEFTLGDYVSLIRGTTYKGDLVNLPGPVLLGLASIQSDGGFRWGAFKTYGGACPPKITLFPGDLYVSLKDVTQSGDLLGSVARVPKQIKSGRLTQDTVKLELSGRPIDPNFLYWLLRTPQYRQFCRARATGTTTLGLAREDFLAFPISDPTPSQISLVELLEAIEARIEILGETNTTLEAIAQALFKSWFVDFDPVHANAGTQAPSLPAEIQALFPSRLVESPQGLIPEGWEVGVFGDIAQQKKGSVNPLKMPDQIFEHYSLPAFDNNQIPIFEPGEFIKSNKTHLPENAVLLSKLNPHIPRVWLPLEYGANAVCSTEFLAYSPKSGASKEFIFTLFSSSAFLVNLQQLVTGTSNSHQRVKPDQILEIGLVIPSKEVLSEFEKATHPIFSRIGVNRAKSQTLANLRDTLLPRLISGQLRLSEAEAALAEVG